MPNKISVIVAAYNAESTLQACIESILKQTYGNFEILIIDDASKDGTYQAALDQAALDGRIKVFKQDKNGGPAAARNRGLAEASGEWVAIVDSDDLILPQRLQAMLETALDKNADIVFDNLFSESADKKSYIPEQLKVFGVLNFEKFMSSHRKLNSVPSMGFLKPLFKRKIITEHGISYRTDLKIGEDTLLIIEMMVNGAKAYLLKDAYYNYERRPGSISAIQTAEHIKAIIKAHKVFLEKYSDRLSDAEKLALLSLISDSKSRILARDFFDDFKPPKFLHIIKSKTNMVFFILEAGSRIKRKLRA